MPNRQKVRVPMSIKNIKDEADSSLGLNTLHYQQKSILLRITFFVTDFKDVRYNRNVAFFGV